MSTEKQCQVCGQAFQPKRAGGVVCSIQCRNRLAGRGGRKRFPRPCRTCGTTFLPKDRDAAYCSINCRAKGTMLPRTPCPICGTTANRAGKIHCSPECAAEAMRKPKTLLPRECAHCGTIFPPKKDGARKFCSRICSARHSGLMRRKASLRTVSGYIMIYAPDSPMATKAGYVMQHRLIAAETIGRSLLRTEVVHHLNGVRDDNRPENLEVMLKPEHDRIVKPPPKPIACPHCGGMIKVSGRVRHVAAL